MFILRRSSSPHGLFEDVRPFDQGVVWLAQCGGLILICLGGWIIGALTLAMCSAMVVYAGLSILLQLGYLGALQQDGKQCHEDFSCLQKLDSHDAARIAETEQRSTFLRIVAAHAKSAVRQGGSDPSPLVRLAETQLAVVNDRCRTAAEMLMAIGLFGTVSGLLIMFGGVEAALNAAGEGALIEGIKKSLSGLGTAFLTTFISTLSGSLILLGLAARGEEAIARLIAQVDALVQYAVVGQPAVEREGERRAA